MFDNHTVLFESVFNAGSTHVLVGAINRTKPSGLTRSTVQFECREPHVFTRVASGVRSILSMFNQSNSVDMLVPTVVYTHASAISEGDSKQRNEAQMNSGNKYLMPRG